MQIVGELLTGRLFVPCESTTPVYIHHSSKVEVQILYLYS